MSNWKIGDMVWICDKQGYSSDHKIIKIRNRRVWRESEYGECGSAHEYLDKFQEYKLDKVRKWQRNYGFCRTFLDAELRHRHNQMMRGLNQTMMNVYLPKLPENITHEVTGLAALHDASVFWKSNPFKIS